MFEILVLCFILRVIFGGCHHRHHRYSGYHHRHHNPLVGLLLFNLLFGGFFGFHGGIGGAGGAFGRGGGSRGSGVGRRF